MNVDEWNLVAASVAAVVACATLGYQYVRDRSVALPVLALEIDNLERNDAVGLRVVCRTVGDATWRIVEFDLLAPRGAGVEIFRMSGGTGLDHLPIHPPVPVVDPGSTLIELVIRMNSQPMAHRQFLARLRIRNFLGRRQVVRAEGFLNAASGKSGWLSQT